MTPLSPRPAENLFCLTAQANDESASPRESKSSTGHHRSGQEDPMTHASLAPTARTLEVPGARLYYEVRGQGPLVVLAGAPMDAGPFGPLAELLAADYTVLTTDPRGINRSPVDDPGQ